VFIIRIYLIRRLRRAVCSMLPPEAESTSGARIEQRRESIVNLLRSQRVVIVTRRAAAGSHATDVS
jgi:hypothetical protein